MLSGSQRALLLTAAEVALGSALGALFLFVVCTTKASDAAAARPSQACRRGCTLLRPYKAQQGLSKLQHQGKQQTEQHLKQRLCVFLYHQSISCGCSMPQPGLQAGLHASETLQGKNGGWLVVKEPAPGKAAVEASIQQCLNSCHTPPKHLEQLQQPPARLADRSHNSDTLLRKLFTRHTVATKQQHITYA